MEKRAGAVIRFGLILASYSVAFAPFSTFGQTYTITTFAGGALPVNITGTSASLDAPQSVALDGAGNVFFVARNAVLRLDALTGILTAVAGNGTTGFSGDNGPAASAQLSNPIGVAVDSANNLYIADLGNNRIRKVSGGVITTEAGNGIQGFGGDNGPAVNAQLNTPAGVAVDSAGNLYISDDYNQRIRKVSKSGVITTIAGNGVAGFGGDGGPATSAQLNYPNAIAVDSAGNLYITDAGNLRIRRVSSGMVTTVAGNGTGGFSGDGGPAVGAQLSGPWGVAVDSAGNLYVADSFNHRIRRVSGGVITTVAGNGTQDFSGDGGSATSANLHFPQGIAVDFAGNLYIADTHDQRVRKVSAGVITTVAGTGTCCFSGDNGPPRSAQLNFPADVAVDSAGNVYIVDTNNNRIRKVSNGVITTVAGNGTTGFSGDNGPALSAELNIPEGVAVDSTGNLYIVDSGNGRIRKVSNGVITTIAGNGRQGSSGDGGPATAAQLGLLDSPSGVAVDAAGNLYIVDVLYSRIRKVSNGVITTVAGGGTSGLGDNGPATSAQLSNPSGLAVDAAGNVYIADTHNNRIRKLSNGVITTVAGGGTVGLGDNGPATSAVLNLSPGAIGSSSGIAVDSAGNLFISDVGNGRIRKVSAGLITTIGGNGTCCFSGDNGPATSAELAGPSGLAVDSSGNVYFAEPSTHRVRLLTPSSSTTCTYSLSSSSFQATADGGNLNFTLTTTAGCAWMVSDLPDWITVSGSASGSGSGTIALVVVANSGAPRSVQISVAGIAVTVDQASNVLLVNTGGVVSDASYTASVAPGSIAAIFGNFLLAAPVSDSSFPLPTSLDGLSFQFSGAPLLPLFYANLGQVNAQVPWELAGQSQTTITATNGSQTSTPAVVNLATYAPGIFTLNGGGTGQGAILGANDHLADSTNAAIAGSTLVQIFCTGLGPVTNQPLTGASAPTGPLAQTTTQPTVMIGGASAQVQFSGLAPGYVGLYQINALVPQTSTKGNAVPVVISIGGVQSNTVTMAVQ